MAKAKERASNKAETLEVLTRARARSLLVSPLKEYLHNKEPSSHGEFITRVNHWVTMRGEDKCIYARREAKKGSQGPGGIGNARGISCFLCGRIELVARECGFRKDEGPRHPVKEEMGEKTPAKKVTCFVCGEAGHKSPACPS